MTHVIAQVTWPKGVQPSGYDDCAVSCVCGWAGIVRDWQDHRGTLNDTARKRAHRATGHTRWELKR